MRLSSAELRSLSNQGHHDGAIQGVSHSHVLNALCQRTCSAPQQNRMMPAGAVPNFTSDGDASAHKAVLWLSRYRLRLNTTLRYFAVTPRDDGPARTEADAHKAQTAAPPIQPPSRVRYLTAPNERPCTSLF